MSLALALVMAGGCATVHPTLESLRDDFAAQARERNVIVRPEVVQLRFIDRIDDGAAGRCFYNQAPRVVEVSREFWNDDFYANDMRRQVVFHELGHCLLGIREHVLNLAVNTPDTLFSGHKQVYVSIMEREPIPYAYYHGHEAEWLDRLFVVDMRAKP